MMKYNESLQKAGVLLALDGLHPPSMGARVSFAGGKPKVTDGPFAEAKEVLGGYWMIQVKSKEEAIEWATRCPGSGQRGDRDPPGAGVRRLPGGGARGGRWLQGSYRRARRRPRGRDARRRRCSNRDAVTATDAHRAIDAVWRIESARLIAGLARMVRDVGLAEELAQDALVAALEQWPESGVPDNPGAWLMATAKHRAIDRCAATSCSSASTRSSATSSTPSGNCACPISRPRSTTTSATTCCGWCSPRATRCSRPRRASRSRCACSAA